MQNGIPYEPNRTEELSGVRIGVRPELFLKRPGPVQHLEQGKEEAINRIGMLRRRKEAVVCLAVATHKPIPRDGSDWRE
jgi:hypothetical protein